jgi:hypothetical protein
VDVANYILKVQVEDLTEAVLIQNIQKKAETLMNWHTSDIGCVFHDHLKMDLTAEDVDEYDAANLMDFDQLVEDHGWSGMLGADLMSDEADHQWMESRCKILLDVIEPELLRVDIQCLAEMTRH